VTRFASLLFVALLPVSCDVIKDQAGLLECSDICTQVDSCEVTPPDASFGNFGEMSSGEAGVDCAVNCASPDAKMLGYSDCQKECLSKSECGEIADCWKPKSATYAEFCLAGVDIPEVGPPAEEPPPGNGSETGNTDVDDIVDDPAVAIAVDEADDGGGFTVNYGDQPPQLIGKYDVYGTIDEASNARPVGSVINTSICFWDRDEQPGGVYISYCEDGVPGQDSAPITGSGDSFTAYFVYDGQATVLFSGTMNPDGTLTSVEALVVYTYTTQAWERSHTDWTNVGTCDSCN
jgi:hypothetical protein